MAKQEELYSLFGIKSPQQMRAERQAQQQAFMRSLQSPEARAGGGIGMALASLFGKPSEEELEAQRAEELMADAMQAEGGQIAKMAALANRFNEAGMPKAAMAALAELDRLKQQEFDRRDTKAAREAQFIKTFNKQEAVLVDSVNEYGDPIKVVKTINVPYQYDVRDPENTQIRLGSSVPAPTGGGGTGKPDPDVRPSVDLATRRVLRNGAEVAQGADGQFYTIVRGADGKAYQGTLVADPKFAPTAEEQAIIDERNAQPIIQIGPKVTKEERDRRRTQQPSTAADDQLNPFSLF